MKFRFIQKINFWRFVQFAVYFSVLAGAVFYGFMETKPAQDVIERDAKTAAIEEALFTRKEFFGADAIVPFPTEQARARLALTLEKFPEDPKILLKLAELDERLGRFDDAEKNIKAVKPDDLQALADFYGRRAMPEKQAETLERILQNSTAETRAEAFSKIINLAKKHDLKKYLAPEFYEREIARSDDRGFEILLAFVDKLTAEKNYAEALKILDETGAKFPALNNQILEKQIAILTLQGKPLEAEKVYRQAFDPFWTEEESEKFYGFLRENDRYRAYESELRRDFRQNPSDFQTAIRLIHFPCYECEDFPRIVRKLESARAERKIRWQPEELLTLSRFSIEKGDGEAASRFLYTLATDFNVNENHDLRRKVLYQLFEILSDAGYQRLALTRGSLDFYETVAVSDARPGITTGILSLIFSDSNPRGQFELKQETAVKLFNRAAAFRVFQEFKKDYPDAPELAQMYLDIVRLYTNSNNLEIAAATLAEFEDKYADFKDFPDAALKLSDAFIAAKQFDKEREIYLKLLDFLGKSGKPKFAVQTLAETSDLTTIKPGFSTTPPKSNEGINVSTARKTSEYYYSEKPSNYRNYLSGEPPREISYADVLSRLVASLARENRQQEILDLYAAETAKHPQEAQLYEQMLQWLGQTNLYERQFEVYRKALQNFQAKAWKDRFARWLIRNKRTADFENFSRSLVATFDDAETQDYLKQFIDGKETYGANDLDSRMFFALYSLAHRRFPHNIVFVKGLLRYYKQNKMEAEWRALLAEYYFESGEIRQEFLTDLSKRGELRAFLRSSEDLSAKNELESLPYKLFRADASRWVSDFEKAVVFYRELNQLYPGESEFGENYLQIARSFGQTNRAQLSESATFAQNQADQNPSDENFRVRAGEIQAELGDYAKARENWQKIIEQSAGENESYLNTATVFWDYFQFDDALSTIKSLREKSGDENQYAFQAGAILEAKNETRAALAEYVKALDGSQSGATIPENFNDLDGNNFQADQSGAKRRLKQLFRRKGLDAEINTAFEKARKTAQNPFQMTYHFSDVLYEIDRQTDAVKLLLRQVETEKSEDNILEARRFFRDSEEPQAVQATLKRLVETAENPRDSMAYRLQLAENFRENYEAEKASAVLADLVRRFPANYGVLKETENFYWDLGRREKSVAVLRAAIGRSRGEYLYRFSRKLAQRLNSMNRGSEAEQILRGLQTENPDDEEVFSELADIYVRTNRADALRKSFAVTMDALARQELEPLEFKMKAGDLRRKMISAFTRLKDYDAAAEQYIEIINRDPEAEENIDQAISFARRYGSARKFLEYYQKTARESFKNYRWNVVLARLHESSGDLPQAAENFKTAIFNQPEMTELYDALGEIYVKMQNYEAALANLDKLLELSGDDKKYVKQKAQLLEKLGKKAEADAALARLPAEDLPKPQSLNEQFAEAQKLRRAETEKSIEIYRQAFENLSQKPFENDIKAPDIAGFVETVHRQETLDSLVLKLWNLREKLVNEIENPDSIRSGKARENLKTLDAAIAESISREIKSYATGGEILALRRDLETRLDATEKTDERSLSLLQNLIFKCGFDDLEEKYLIRTANDSAGSETHGQALRALLSFYQKRNDHRRILETLESDPAQQPLEFVRIYAASARILEETDKESAAVQIIFANQTTDDELTNRYLEILYETNRAELENLARNPARHPLQIINFLLAKNEPEVATEAIKNSVYSDAWKNLRAAETRYKSGRFDPSNEVYFTDPLRPGTVGEMIRQNSADPKLLAGSDWFNFADLYGKWLYAAAQTEKAEYYLAAKTENHPQAADEQFDLGYFYLRQKSYARALEHFQIASELMPGDKSLLAFTGAAYFQLGEKEKAFGTWSQIIEDEEDFENAALYLKTLADFGQTAKARADLKPVFIERLKSFENYERSDEAVESLKEFVRALAKSFSSDAEKTAFFLEICRAAPENTMLPEMLIDEALVSRQNFGAFYRILIERTAGLGDYEHDYEFVSLLETSWETGDAELLYDGANDFKLEEPENERLTWQQKYLEYLLDNRDFNASAKLVAEIENSLKGQYPRPVWLRLAELRADLNSNKSATLAKMLRFTGVEVSSNAQTAVLPSAERLNQAVEILEKENRSDLKIAVQEAFFARQLALGQFNAANFIGLARIEFEKGDATEALKILKIMTEFSAEESRAELDALPLLAKFSNKENLPVSERYDPDEKATLAAAAEILSEFGRLAEAAVTREKLRAIAPDDALNRIELGRLYTGTKTVDDAARILIELIADKSVARNFRWLSLLVLAETVGTDAARWRKITEENQGFEQQDAEIWNALAAVSQFQTGQADPAVGLLEENGFTWQLRYLRTIFEKNAGRDGRALDSLTELSKFKPEINEIFGFNEAASDFQIINLYLKTGKTRAALDWAKYAEILKAVQKDGVRPAQNFKFKTLEQRRREIELVETRRVLEQLSLAAEAIGNYSQAVEFEKARSAYLSTPEETEKSAARIETLEQKKAAQAAEQAELMVVTEKY